MSEKRGRGRPRSDNRAAARLLGDKTYSGKRCRQCNGTERYLSNSACVACQTQYSRNARKVMRRISGDELAALLGEEAPMTMDEALAADAEKLQQLTGEDHSCAQLADDLGDLMGDTTPEVRYFVHYESGCVFQAIDDGPLDDGLVEEISRENYERLAEEGFTRTDLDLG